MGTTYQWGHLRPDDVVAWSELTNLLADVDGTGEYYSAEDLAEELAEDGVDPALDTWAVWDTNRLVAYGQVRVAAVPQGDGRVRCQLGGGVHPDHRGHGIGRELMDRMEARAVDLGAARHPGRPAYLRSPGGPEGATVRRLLERRGYRIIRHFNQMSRPLPGGPVAVDHGLADDLRLVEPTDEHREAVRLAHNAAFVDHWGSSPQTEARWADMWRARSRRPELSCLVVDASGRILSYVLCGQWVDRELYVDLVGTRPEARGRGLARAALGRVVELAAAAGDHDVVELDVDSASPTGATRLYDQVGFELTKVFAAYGREL